MMGPLAMQNEYGSREKKITLTPLTRWRWCRCVTSTKASIECTDYESGLEHDFRLVLRLRTTAHDVNFRGKDQEDPGPPGGFTHPMRTSYELPDNHYCKKCGSGRQHRCHEKIKTTYELMKCLISTVTGLLRVNR